MIAHTDFVSIFNPPAGEKVSEVEFKDLEAARMITGKIFHPSVPNAEGFNRLHMKDIVPYSNKPALPGQPWITVSASHTCKAVVLSSSLPKLYYRLLVMILSSLQGTVKK